MEFSHTPVMAAEVTSLLGCKSAGIYVDGTLGGGGHALEILKASSPDGVVVGIDLDEDALKAAGRLLEPFGDRVRLARGNFRDMRSILAGLGMGRVDGIVLDLGVSSHQLDAPERGFSFRADARLDMRMDRSRGLSAYDIVNGYEASELARIFREYGEERHARRIAGLIEKARKTGPVETTGDLVNIVLCAIPKRFHGGRKHPATKVFQALRMAVNDELQNLEQGLAEGVACLKSGGRFAVISFHSLEDRMVKNTFRELAAGCVCPPRAPRCVCGKKATVRVLTKKALTPASGEVETNPRARSAKLRAIETI